MAGRGRGMSEDIPRTALQVAQEYLDWYDCKQRMVERVVVVLNPDLSIVIQCTDGASVEVTYKGAETKLRQAIKREWDEGRKVVAEIERQKKLEGIS